MATNQRGSHGCLPASPLLAAAATTACTWCAWGLIAGVLLVLLVTGPYKRAPVVDAQRYRALSGLGEVVGPIVGLIVGLIVGRAET